MRYDFDNVTFFHGLLTRRYIILYGQNLEGEWVGPPENPQNLTGDLIENDLPKLTKVLDYATQYRKCQIEMEEKGIKYCLHVIEPFSLHTCAFYLDLAFVELLGMNMRETEPIPFSSST